MFVPHADSASGDDNDTDSTIHDHDLPTDVQDVPGLLPLDDESRFMPGMQRLCIRLAYYGSHSANCNVSAEVSDGDPVILILCDQCLQIQDVLTFRDRLFARSSCCASCLHPRDVNVSGRQGFIWLSRDEIPVTDPPSSAPSTAPSTAPHRSDGSLLHPTGADPNVLAHIRRQHIGEM